MASRKAREIADVPTRREEERMKARLRELEADNERLEHALQQARHANAKIPVQGKLRTSKGAFVRFFVPDTHGCKVDHEALSAMLAVLAYLNPREVYLMGDHLDCDGFLAQHHVWGFVAETEYTFEDDVAAANVMLDSVQKICPKAKLTYLSGNHESRIERFCVTTALRRTADAEFLRRQIGAENVLHIEKRGIRYISTGEFYDDCRIQGTVRAGKCFVTHGTRHGKNAAQQMLSRFNACVVFGHVHKLLSASDRNVKDGEIGAWSVGHLGQQQPCWRHGDPTDWSQGYGFQIVQPSGDFLHINVPIIEGRSYLYTLGKLLN